MMDSHSSSVITGGGLATGISLKNSAVARSFSDATWAQVMDGSFQLHMSDVLAVAGVIGLFVNVWLGIRKDYRQQTRQQKKSDSC